MNTQKSWIAFIVIIFLTSGIVSACSTRISRQNSIIDLGTELKLQEIVASGELPSVQIAIIDQNQLIWSETLGQNSDNNHVYMNGSVQKVVDATAVLQLYEKGQIDLDADINDYIPFAVKHPEYPDIPVTIRMLLSHRSGLDAIGDQFSWDTECLFRDYRPNCNLETLQMSPEEYFIASFTPGGANYNPQMWLNKPGEKYHYSVSAYPLLRYLIEQVSAQSYPEYMHENIFAPLGMLNTGFVAEDFAGRYAFPFTRIDGINIELPVWNGNGYMMRTTAEDMGKFMLAHMNNGSYNQFQLLQPETIQMMQAKESEGRTILNRDTELSDAGYGLGIIHYANGWLGHGGSTVGYQTLWQFNPAKQCGIIISTNVNGILGDEDDFMSVWEHVAEIRDLLVKRLDPLSTIRSFPWGLILTWAVVIILSSIIMRRRRSK